MHLEHFLSQMGRHSEASQSMRRARELDPLYAMMHALSSQVAFAREVLSTLEAVSRTKAGSAKSEQQSDGRRTGLSRQRG